jgi:hypothetical protein
MIAGSMVSRPGRAVRGMIRIIYRLALRLLPAFVDTAASKPQRASDARRPGYACEAVRLSTGSSKCVQLAAARRGVTAGLAAGLLLELALCDEWLASADGLVGRNVSLIPAVALSAAEADYVRALGFGARCRIQPKAPAPVVVSIPVRLLPHATPERLERASRGDIDRAVDCEIAAMRAGLLMTEWALLAALFARDT